MQKFVIAAAAGLLSLTATAQRNPAWPQEPAAVFGVALGQKLDNDRISECGGVKVETDKPQMAVCAMARPGFGGIPIAGFPVPLFEDGYIGRDDGVVTSVILNGKQANYRDIRALLIERYGRPAAITTEKLQNKMGASFTSEILSWQGKNVNLMLRERSETADKTVAFFTHRGHMEKIEAERGKTIKESATKM